MQNSKNLTSELVSRKQQYSFFQYIGMLPNPDKVLSRTGKTIEAYRDLKNDPHVWSCIQSRKSGLLSLDYRIIPDGASSSVLAELTTILHDIDVQQVIRDMLEALLFGYQPIEIIWKLQGAGQKYFVPERILAKPQEWFFFDGDGLLRYRTSGNSKGEIPPPMKIICIQHEASYLNPYGHALLGKCYWPVTFKNGGLRFWVNFMERYGMPLLTGQYTRGATMDETRKLAQELANMTEDSVIVAPSDIQIQLHEAARSSSVELYRELIKHCNSEISKAMLSQTLTTELEGGSYAASETHFKVRRDVIQSDVRLVESGLNEIIRYIVELNFGNVPAPTFTFILDDGEADKRLERDTKLVKSCGLTLTKQYWMSAYGFKEEELG
ncbi:MAG: hypothetical protein HW421_3794 [Ignavibacteria bacterium]|nr:hypothetical protein [Ignavibacteria bacterium]